MPQKVDPCRTLQAANQAALWRKHAWKRQDVRDQDKRREEISTRDHEDGARAQNGKLGEQEDRGDRIAHEHRSRIGRDEGVDPARLDARKRPSGDQHKDDQDAEHDSKSQPFLRRTWRQAREDEKIFLWDVTAVLSIEILFAAAAARDTKVMTLGTL